MSRAVSEEVAIPKSAIHTLPIWARCMIAALLIAAIAICAVLGMPRGVWLLIGPLLLVHMWTGREFAGQKRAERPMVFWAIFAVFSAMTAWGLWDLGRWLTGAGQ